MDRDTNIPESLKWRPGDLIGNRYQIESLLGQGGFGCVLKATDKTLNRKVAVKTVYRAILSDQDIVRFQKEAKALAKIKHANVVDVFDFGVLKDGDPFLVMEFITGETLEEFYKKNNFDLEYTFEVFNQICQGIKAVHNANLVHRDIKATNIIVSKTKGNFDCVKLLDFGIARGVDGEEKKEQTISGVVKGTPLYMSPEQGKEMKLDKRTDIYSLGCLLYRLLVGSPPFLGETGFEVISKHISERAKPIEEARPEREFPPGLNQLIEEMMAKSPEDRVSNIETVIYRINNLAGDQYFDQELEMTLELEKSTRIDPAVLEQTTTVFDIYSKSNRKNLFIVVCLLGMIVAGWGLYLFRGETSNISSGRSIFGPDIKPAAHSFIYNGAESETELINLLKETANINTLIITAPVEDRVLELLLKLSPENLGIIEANLSNSNWHLISSQKSIHNLGIFRENQITAENFQDINKLHLDKVTIYNTRFTDTELKILSTSRSIQELAIGKNNSISGSGLKELIHARTLVYLNLDRCKNINSADIDYVNRLSSRITVTSKKLNIEEDFAYRKNHLGNSGVLADDLSNLFVVHKQ